MLEKRLKLLSKCPFFAKCFEELEDVGVGIASQCVNRIRTEGI